MILKVVCVCMDCYVKNKQENNYGEDCKVTDKKEKCEVCGKEEYLLLTTEPIKNPKKYTYNI